jgi:preprotein translocase SecE subunit
VSVVKAESEGGGKRSFVTRAREYFTSLKYEWQKVTFPDRKQWLQSTLVVFLFTMALMAIIFCFDWVVGQVFRVLIFK